MNFYFKIIHLKYKVNTGTAEQLNDINISLASHITAWAGDTVSLNCSVSTGTNLSSLIIWQRQQDSREELVAHHQQVLLAGEHGETKFQVKISESVLGPSNRTVLSELTVSS